MMHILYFSTTNRSNPTNEEIAVLLLVLLVLLVLFVVKSLYWNPSLRPKQLES